MQPSPQVAARVRAARAYAGISHARFAGALGVSAATLRRLERAEAAFTADRLGEIAQLTGVPLAWLLSGWGEADGAVAMAMLELRAHLDARMGEMAQQLLAISNRLDRLEPPGGG